MNPAIALLILFTALTALAQTESKIRVACIGDSITYGSGIQGRESNSYPAVLQRLLGDRYEVRNFGVSATTLLKKGDKPYWNDPAFAKATRFQPQVVVIKLGTNDTKPQNKISIRDFATDYAAMIDHFARLRTKPTIYACLPVPVFATRWGINEATVTNAVLPAIRKAAAEKKVHVIDLHQALSGKPELFPDQVHPNAEGARLIAEAVAAAVSASTRKSQ